MSVFTRGWLILACCSNAGFCPNSDFTLFTGELLGAGWSQRSYCDAGFVQNSDFTLFTGELLGAGWSQRSYCDAGFVQNSDFTLFTGELPGGSWIQHLFLTLVSVQTENSPSDFSSVCRLFLVRRFCRPIIRISSSTTSLNHAASLTLTSFVQQTIVYRVQLAYPFSLLPL